MSTTNSSARQSATVRHDVAVTSAWKFLDDRSRDPLSGVRWPLPTELAASLWVDVEGIGSATGVRACNVDQLALWMSAQLWEVELDGAISVDEIRITAGRGRLVRLIDGWPAIGLDLSLLATWSVRDHAVAVLTAVGDEIGANALANAGDIAALSAAVAAMVPDLDTPGGVAVATVSDIIADLGDPVLACHDAARAAGHRSSAIDGSIGSYWRGFNAERLAQSDWIAAQLGLTTSPQGQPTRRRQ